MNMNTEWEPRSRSRSNLHVLALLATAALLLVTACSSHKKEQVKERARAETETAGGPPVALAASSFALQAPPGAGARFIAEREGPLRILSAVPNGALDELPPGLALSVTFGRPMVALGRETPPPAGAIVLTPPVAGRCRWEGTQTLVFEPAAPLPPATPFAATLAGGESRRSSRKHMPSQSAAHRASGLGKLASRIARSVRTGRNPAAFKTAVSVPVLAKRSGAANSTWPARASSRPTTPPVTSSSGGLPPSPHAATASSPPFRSTRRTSAIMRSGSGTTMTPRRHNARSNAPVLQARVSPSISAKPRP